MDERRMPHQVLLRRIMPVCVAQVALVLVAAGQSVDTAHRTAVIAQFENSQTFRAVATGPDGSIYVAGTTSSPRFAVLNAAQPGLGGDVDAFVAKVAPDGTMQWATFLGGSGPETVVGLVVDHAGDIYVAGQTFSTDFPVTLPLVGSQPNGFLVKYDPRGAVAFSVAFGGEGDDRVTAFAADVNNGVAVLTGSTTSKAFPVTPGASATVADVRDDNGFAIEFDHAGSLVFATYLPGFSQTYTRNSIHPLAPPRDSVLATIETGGSILVAGTLHGYGRLAPDGSTLTFNHLPILSPSFPISALTADASGNIFMLGSPYSPPEPSGGCFYGFYSPSIRLYYPDTKIYVAKLAKDSPTPQWLTQMAASCGAVANGINIGPDGSVVVTGYAESVGFPMLNPVRETGGSVTFVLGPDGALRFSSYLDGPAVFNNTGDSVYAFALSPVASLLQVPVRPSNATFSIGAARNAFSGISGPIAPGMLLRIDGKNFTDGDPVEWELNNPDTPPTTMGGIQVLFNGTPAQMVRVASDHVICIVPGTISFTQVQVQVFKEGSDPSTVFEIAGAKTSIGLFPMGFPDVPNSIQGNLLIAYPSFILNADGTVNSSDNPATAGSGVMLFATGLGDPVVDGTQVSFQVNIFNPQSTPFPPPPGQLAGTVRSLPGFIPGLAAIDLTIPGSGPQPHTLLIGSSKVIIYCQ